MDDVVFLTPVNRTIAIQSLAGAPAVATQSTGDSGSKQFSKYKFFNFCTLQVIYHSFYIKDQLAGKLKQPAQNNCG